RTGVGDIRELIEGVRYAPVEGRYKVYIIDEVHMLSNSAFNALLKTLEEPPPHVKFIFATTEIRKVPVTVLSRCQRFDLRRFDIETLSDHLQDIAQREGAEVAPEALRMMARAAEGSVRDALSLLDQAIIQHAGDAVSEAAVRDMLGLVDRTLTWDLLDAAMKGESKTALDLFREQYNSGADPAQVMRDLLDLTHLLTRTKAAGPTAASHGGAGEADAARAQNIAEGVALPALTRVWSLLMKSLEEVMVAPDPAAAAEIGLIRLAYTASLPTPEDALKMVASSDPTRKSAAPVGAAPASSSSPPGGQARMQTTAAASSASGAPTALASVSSLEPAPRPSTAAVVEQGPQITSLEDIAALAATHRDARLRTQIETCIRPVTVAPGRLDIVLTDKAPTDLPGNLMKALKDWTGEHWVVSVVRSDAAGPTLRQTRDEAIENHPLVKAALDAFPDAKITAVRPIVPPKTEA
ncbi:MAG: DNA polymerase III subunit gamma/tau, partial [Pseudomonadota bacterium]